MNNSYKTEFWMELTERCWVLFWRVLTVFLMSAAVPGGIIFGLRVLKAIRPVVAP